jgi:hypothetical protein
MPEVAGPLNNRSTARDAAVTASLDHALSFVILLGLTPAVMTSLIAPRFWIAQFALCAGECRPVRIVEPFLSGIPVYSAFSAVLFVVGLALALRLRWRWKALLLMPLALFVVRGLVDGIGDDLLPLAFGPGRYFAGEWLYNVSTSVVFLCLVFSPGRIVRTYFFAAYIAFLFVAIYFEPHFGFGKFLFFLASFLVTRIVFRFAKENLAMFARLGAGRTAALLGKALVLMLPIIALIGIGEFARQKVESGVLDSVYSSRPLCTYSVLLAAARTPYADPETEAANYVGAVRCPPLTDPGQPGFDVSNPDHVDQATLKWGLAEEAREKLPALHRSLVSAGQNPCSVEVPAETAAPELERDLCYYTEYLHAGRAAAMKKELLQHRDGRAKNADEIRRDARVAARQGLPNVTIYRDTGCYDFPWLPCEIKQSVLWITDKAVNSAISRARGSLVQRVDDIVGDAEEVNADMTLALEAEVDDAVEQMQLATRAALSNGFDLVGVVDHVLLVLLVLAFLKSLLFIFARVVFSSVDPDASIDFADDRETASHGAITVHGKRYSLTGDGSVFYARHAQVEGIAPSITLPQPFSCILNRVVSGVYLMNRANTARAKEGRVVFKTGDVRQLVEWHLREGEQVIFHFKDFIAADTAVTFSTLISFRIPTLLMGRLVYRVARGPGRLILRTDGAAETIDGDDAVLSKPVHRVVAWSRAARFKLEAEQSFADIYLSDVHVKMTPGDRVIFVAEAGDKRHVGTGAARFLKTFLLPI